MTDKGNMIAELRREAGYTQKTLAEALHITDKAVSKWERGISMPDVSLLPKLSLLLDADIELLLTSDHSQQRDRWEGLLDLRGYNVNLRMPVYDKPMVYYMLSHYLLIGINRIHVLTTEGNRKYLSEGIFGELGFQFSFREEEIEGNSLMVMDRPCFLFGSDLSRQYQGAMAMGTAVKLVPENVRTVFLFCPAEYVVMYMKNPGYLYETAVKKTLGRGMICLDMDDVDAAAEAAGVIRSYQARTGMLIGGLEEIAYRRGLINREKLEELAADVPYKTLLHAALNGM